MKSFKLYIESRDSEQMRNLGLDAVGMRAKKAPHGRYNFARADKVADADLIQKKRNTERNRQRSYQHYYGTIGIQDAGLLLHWKTVVEELSKTVGPPPMDIRWHSPDPYELYALADWIEENGVDSSPLRDYAKRTAEMLQMGQQVYHAPPERDRQWQKKDPFTDVDYDIDQPRDRNAYDGAE